jgi:hypothetical protein
LLEKYLAPQARRLEVSKPHDLTQCHLYGAVQLKVYTQICWGNSKIVV